MNITLTDLQTNSDILKRTIKDAVAKFAEQTGVHPNVEVNYHYANLQPCGPKEIVDIKINVEIPV